MALVLIPGPDNAPSTAADWDKINDVLQTIGLDMNKPTRIKGGYIQRGSVIFFAGAWYVADSDTAVTGSATDYVRLTNSAGTVTAAFVSSLSNVTFNRTWNGWYDSSLRLYLFDEIKAYAAGAVTSPVTIKNFRPSLNWSKAWSRVLSAANLARLFRLSSEVVLTGSGNWTVPSGVYWIEGDIIGPGANGGRPTSGETGDGGNAGLEQYFGQAVTPGDEISYSITSTSTIFGSITVLKGTGNTGSRGDTVQNGRGGNGGGLGGIGGGNGGNGGAGRFPGGGGGGAGYRNPKDPTPPVGGAGALGTVRIR